jgi:RHS repeat-associated protein
LLTRKAYSDGNGTDYTYTPANQLYRRLWTRTVASVRVTTEYAYDAATGELTSINYSDATPDVTFTYDRLGRPATVADIAGTRTFGYSATTLQPVTETFGATYFGGRILTYLYQGSGAGLVPGRPGGYRLGTSGLPGQDVDVAHTYDTAGRLSGVTSGAGAFTYGYVTDSPLLSGVSGPQVTTTYAYEADRDLRTEVLNKVGTTTVSRYGYRSDAAGRRKDRVQEGTAFTATTYDRFGYNPRGEVTQSKNFTGTNPDAAADPENTALARLYGYDVIGNRLTSTVGTATARAYTSNALNQYTAITNPAASPAHDLDGNQTVTGTGWHYEWDAENRLSLARDYATSPVNGSRKVEYTYDYRSRRIRKTESTYTAGAWAVADDRKFLYEGWNLLGEFATSGFARICSYTWGLDLSQTAQGAGGVGGLLAVTTVTPSAATYFATYDGNGNVSEYINGSGGIEAHFEYDAFGDVTRTTGTDLGRFNHRFSTKYWDATVALNYYGFRYYSPSTGRWPNRDPLEEEDGPNLYAYVQDDPINAIDPLGLYSVLGLEFDDGKSFLENVGDYAGAAASGAAQGGSCWARCMAEGAGIPIGTAAAGLAPMTPIPKAILPNAITRGGGLGGMAGKSGFTSAARVFSLATGGAGGSRGLAQAIKDIPGKTAGRLAGRAGAVGAAGLSGYCAYKCSKEDKCK